VPSLRLRPWPFDKNAQVLLYWICSPYKDARGYWRVRVAFLQNSSTSPDQENIQLVDYPWGTLPILRIGRFYVDGLPVNDSSTLTEQSVSIVDFQEGSICKAFDIPRSLYDFRKNRSIGFEKLWRFKAGGITYYIPCLELTRVFLAPSKTMANRLLAPYGLDSLIEQASGDNRRLIVLLSGDVPVALVNDYFISHLLWLYFDESARGSWESIYSHVFKEAITLNPIQPSAKLADGIKLQVRPPIKGPCNLTFTGVFDRNLCLILEIIKVSGMPVLPFEEIVYSHPLIKPNKTSSKSIKRKLILGEQIIIYELDAEHRSVRKDSYQPLVAASIISMDFGHLPNFICENFDEAKSEINSTSATGGLVCLPIKPTVEEKNYLASTAESSIGGKIRPVEFAGLRLTASEVTRGLEKFLEAVMHLAEEYPEFIFERGLYELPGNKPFSRLSDGSTRTCAIIKVFQGGIHPSFILEVARPDFWSISTLFISVRTGDSLPHIIEKEILELLEDMVQRDGHWNIAKLEQSPTLRVLLLKHKAKRSAWTWSQRILNKLFLFGFR
jgi:hypothetical protein